MKKLSLLLLLLTCSLAAFAGIKSGAPSRLSDDEVGGENYFIYQRTSSGFAFINSAGTTAYTGFVPQSGIIEIQTTDGGLIYFVRNIVYGSEKEFGNYWVEGESDQEGGFTIPLGQTIYKTRGRKAVLSWGTVSYNASTGQTTFTRDESVSYVTYTMDGNTIHIENTSGPDAVDAQEDVSYDATGLSIVWEDEEASGDDDNYEWAGYCEWGTGLDTTPYVISWEPEGELKTYNRTSDCIYFSNNSRFGDTFSQESLSEKGDIMFDYANRVVYLKDPLLSINTGNWVMGSLNDDGTLIRVRMPQFLRFEDLNNYIMPATVHTSIINFYDHDQLNLEYDYEDLLYKIEGNTITMQETWGDFTEPYPYNYFVKGLYAYDMVNEVGSVEANIVYVLDSDDPIEPTEKTSAPVINGYTVDNTNGYFVAITPTEPSTIYYRVQQPNSRAFTEWAEYIDVLCYTTPGDYTIEAYALANGKLASDHVSYDFTVSPVTSINEVAGGKQIASRRYFNVMGQEVQQPVGVTIIVTTYSDGTTTSVKVVK